MTTYYLRLHLQSDTTFGRGDGVAGWIDAEVEHDEYGLPFLRGRALKGLLVEECAHLLFALGVHNEPETDLYKAALKLWGQGGSDLAGSGGVIVGDARLPEDLRQACRAAIAGKSLTRQEILASLTALRRQTALDVRGAPLPESLRAMRVVLRDTVFEAELRLDSVLDDCQLGLLAASVKSLRRVGTGRNRGRGRVTSWLSDKAWNEQSAHSFTAAGLQKFQAVWPPAQPKENAA
jgi:hypothetical protein